MSMEPCQTNALPNISWYDTQDKIKPLDYAGAKLCGGIIFTINCEDPETYKILITAYVQRVIMKIGGKNIDTEVTFLKR